MTALIDEADGSVTPSSVLMPYAELTILDDWYATGLAGTGSNTTVADDVLVPAHRILPLAQQLSLDRRRSATAMPSTGRCRPIPWLIAQAAAAPVGIARGALEAFMARLAGRAITYTDYADQSQAPITHLQVAEAIMKIDSADAHGRRAIALIAEHAGSRVPRRRRGRACVLTPRMRRRSRARRWTCSITRAGRPRSRRPSRFSASSATSRRSPTTPS